jgi:hypothetical protein
MISLLILLLLTKNPLLRITPEVGFNPIKIYSVRYPDKTDSEWEIVAVDEGFVSRRYNVTVEGEDGDKSISLEWKLTPGSYIIASCVYPRNSCTTKSIEVK